MCFCLEGGSYRIPKEDPAKGHEQADDDRRRGGSSSFISFQEFEIHDDGQSFAFCCFGGK